MTGIPPLKFRWDGEAMRPVVATAAEGLYEAGRAYWLEPWEPASSTSRNHYFASIKGTWDNLPEHLIDRFPTPEHLRKFALIRAGYRDERTIVAGSKAEALRIAAFIKPMDEFAVVTVHEATVAVHTAQSQSAKAMGRATFQESKQKVLDLLAPMIGVSSAQLGENAGQAA